MSQHTLTGSCLCGAVHYEISGEPTRFYHCHCRRCRKASGTGHATNLMVVPESFVWTRGEDLVRTYKLPEAERFSTSFCAQCGGPLPRLVPQLHLVVIPAGSLDSMPWLEPQARIFWGSRADWSCPPGDLPVFAEYPTSVG